MNTIKELLGIDFDDKGLAETIDSVTVHQMEMEVIHDAIGRAIFKDGGLLEDGEHLSSQMIKEIAFDDDQVMKLLCWYASRSESFMERL